MTVKKAIRLLKEFDEKLELRVETHRPNGFVIAVDEETDRPFLLGVRIEEKD